MPQKLPFPNDLEDSPNTIPPEKEPSEEVLVLTERIEELTNKYENSKQELEDYKRRYKGIDHLDDMIKPYASKIFWFMAAYCLFVGLVVLMNSFGCFKHQIDTTVMSFLVGSTATTVLGLVSLVVTGIFSGVRSQRNT